MLAKFWFNQRKIVILIKFDYRLNKMPILLNVVECVLHSIYTIYNIELYIIVYTVE